MPSMIGRSTARFCFRDRLSGTWSSKRLAAAYTPKLSRRPDGSGLRKLPEVVRLDDVALLEVLEVGQADAALVARLHLADVVLEALERSDGAVPDHDPVAQEADLRAARDRAVADVAAGNLADPRHREDLPHLGFARDHFGELGLQHPFEGRVDVFEHLVDDLIEAH